MMESPACGPAEAAVFLNRQYSAFHSFVTDGGVWFAYRMSPMTPAQRLCECRAVVKAESARALADELNVEYDRDEQASHVHVA